MVRKTGLLFNENLIQWIFPPMKVIKTGGNLVLIHGIGHGGTTTLTAGNAVRQDQGLKVIGINLDAEFQELSHEIPAYTGHRKSWSALTREAYNRCLNMGLQPQVTPKLVQPERCIRCGKCVLGCSQNAKWDSRRFLNQAVEKGAWLISGCRVQKVVIEKGQAAGVVARLGRYTRFFPADLVILAAGGLGTPVILQQSGFDCHSGLFVDPVLCVAARYEKSRQNREIPMPFIIQKEHFIISPYFDFLSFFFNPRWRYPAENIFSLMIKLADTGTGHISPGGIRKSLSDIDKARLNEGVECCKEILRKMGIKDSDIFLGTLNAGHPGGMLPLSEKESRTLHHGFLPPNLYVSDASLIPGSRGNPLVLTIAALAKRISKICWQ